MSIKIEVTEEQAKNWNDFREAEKLIPSGSNLAVWQAVDILRLRRNGNTYEEIQNITSASVWHVKELCKAERRAYYNGML